MLLRALAVLITLAGPALAEPLPFEGTWDCDGGPMTFSAQTYQGQPIQSIEAGVPGDYLVTMQDGYRFALMDVTATGLTWSSPESGDIMECRRASGAVAAAGDLSAWNGRPSYELFGDASMQAPLVALMGQDAYEDAKWTFSVAPEMRQYGDWVSGTGCRAHMCNQEYGAVALNLRDGRILVAMKLDGEAMRTWGEARGDLPPPIVDTMMK
ncbi:hypothetical protein FHG66_20290 [Rubellimicrobium rubrum]|uniref:Uncharacterized protein n=1 Tax=Rubellimicrobium rubrum TaxID=2585369 RepID=A0A5C4MK24_9RHOB|nr:hypothetical protein [Rubellimicrobium rubrum]TNC45135.1 hypothetical protein FHG66_20290 [Rubellimicrobium rubrum]